MSASLDDIMYHMAYLDREKVVAEFAELTPEYHAALWNRIISLRDMAHFSSFEQGRAYGNIVASIFPPPDVFGALIHTLFLGLDPASTIHNQIVGKSDVIRGFVTELVSLGIKANDYDLKLARDSAAVALSRFETIPNPSQTAISLLMFVVNTLGIKFNTEELLMPHLDWPERDTIRIGMNYRKLMKNI